MQREHTALGIAQTSLDVDPRPPVDVPLEQDGTLRPARQLPEQLQPVFQRKLQLIQRSQQRRLPLRPPAQQQFARERCRPLLCFL